MSDNEIKKILIVTNVGFPNGMAATNRLISHAKSFIFNNVKTKVLIMNKTEILGNVNNTNNHGIFEGVEYNYIFNKTVISKFIIVRAIEKYLKSIKLFYIILKSCNSNTAILYYSAYSLPALSIRLASLITRSVFVKEETEHPDIRILEKRNFIEKYFFRKLHYRLFDGILVITKQLLSYFKEVMKYSKPVILIPMIVDIDRFNNMPVKKIEINNIVFTGEIDEQKEGISTLIRAFAQAFKKYNNMTLNIYGKAKDKDKIKQYEELIDNLGVENNITINSYKKRDEVTKILLNADILIFPRPYSLQASFGFSTKLGEYLATGNPVIATDVGEVPNYLKYKENAFLCKPTEESLKKKILEIKENPKLAIEVGNRGRITAETFFNNKVESKKIIEFCLLLKNNLH